MNPASHVSDFTYLLQICLRSPTSLLSWGFQSSAWLVLHYRALRRVWPIHPHFPPFISMKMGSWLVFSQRLLFDMMSGHLILRIWRRHMLTKDWSFVLVVFDIFLVSQPYNRLYHKILVSVLMKSVLSTNFCGGCRRHDLSCFNNRRQRPRPLWQCSQNK